MTDKQRLALLEEAERQLKLTKEGYDTAGQTGGHWRAAMQRIEAVERSLRKPPKPPAKVPNLGPVWRGGDSILIQDLTHMTSGMPEGDIYPALDDAFEEGTTIIAPEFLTVTKSSSSKPGLAFYATGRSGIRYWFGHLDRTHSSGTFRKGQTIGKVIANSIGGGPHVHVGIDARALTDGKVLLHHTNYTHGAPLVGVQLRKAA